MDFLGIELDKETNKTTRSIEKIISSTNSKVKVMVVPTNEELVIAKDTMEIIMKLKSNKKINQ